MAEAKKTVVLGASANPSRYSYLAVNKLRAFGHPVIAIGKKKEAIGTLEILDQAVAETSVDTVTLYLNPERQKEYYDYILSLKPNRIIFNPGTENSELETLAKQHGIKPVQACTLVMLSTGQY